MGTPIGRPAALVTGGTSGIGLGIVTRFLAEGHVVVINYFSDQRRAAALARRLEAAGYAEGEDFIMAKADIGDEAALSDALARVPAGVVRNISAVVNNAGVLRRGDIRELTQRDWEDVFAVNVFGTVNVAKWAAAACPALASIVNIGSVRGDPHAARTSNAIYSASKSVIPTITALLAKSFGPSVRVNAVIPGTIDTPQRQGISREERVLYGEKNAIVGRLGRPDEVAGLCWYLSSPAAAYITGASLVIDGGYGINYIK